MSQQKHLGKRCHQEYPGASTKQEYVRGKRPSTVRNIKKKSGRLMLSHVSGTWGFLRHCEVGQTGDQDSRGAWCSSNKADGIDQETGDRTTLCVWRIWNILLAANTFVVGRPKQCRCKSRCREIKQPSLKPVPSRFKTFKSISPSLSQITGTTYDSWDSDPPSKRDETTTLLMLCCHQKSFSKILLNSPWWNLIQQGGRREKGAIKQCTLCSWRQLTCKFLTALDESAQTQNATLRREERGGTSALGYIVMIQHFNSSNIQVKLWHNSVYSFWTTRNSVSSHKIISISVEAVNSVSWWILQL